MRETEKLSWQLTTSPGTSQGRVNSEVEYTGCVPRQHPLHSSSLSSHMLGLVNIMTLYMFEEIQDKYQLALCVHLHLLSFRHAFFPLSDDGPKSGSKS